MSKKILCYDLGLFGVEELLLLLLHFIIGDTHTKIIDYFILTFELLFIVTMTVLMTKSIKTIEVSIKDIIITLAFFFTSFFIYFIVYNNLSVFNGAKGFVFLGLTMSIGWYGLEYLSCFCYYKGNSIIEQNSYIKTLYLAFSILLEKAAIITAIATIIITFVLAIYK